MAKMMTPERRVLIGLVHKAAKLAALSEDDRRAVQLSVTGKASCADMSAADLRAVLWHYKGKGVDIGVPGAAARGGSGWQQPSPAQWTQIERLAQAIGLSDGLDDARLLVFVRRTAQVDALRFLSRKGATDVISGLMRWRASQVRRGAKEASPAGVEP